MATSGEFINNSGYGASHRQQFEWALQSQDIASNTSTIYFEHRLLLGTYATTSARYDAWGTIDGGSYSGGRSVTNNSTGSARSEVIVSGTRTIYHNSDGTKAFSVSASMSSGWSGFGGASGSGSWDLPTIPRHGNITNTSGNINDERTDPWIEFTNPAGGSTQVWLELPNLTGATRYAQRNGVGSRYTWALTTAELNAIRTAMANTNTTTLRYKYANQVGGSWVERAWDNTITMINASPAFTTFTYADVSASAVAITGNNQVLIQNISHLTATITSANKAVAQKYATMKSYTASCAGKQQSQDYSATATVNLTLEAITQSGLQALTVTAIDSRGNTKAVSKNITVIPYSAPTVSVSATRANGFENATTVKIAGAMSLIQVGGVTKNAVNTASGIKYRYKAQSTSTWGAWTNRACTVGADGKVTVADLILQLNNQQSYDIQVSITDKIQTVTAGAIVNVGLPAFYIGKDGRVAVGGMPTKAKTTGETGILEVAGRIFQQGKELLTDTVGSVTSENIDFTTFPSKAIAIAGGNATLYTLGVLKVLVFAGTTTYSPTGVDDNRAFTIPAKTFTTIINGVCSMHALGNTAAQHLNWLGNVANINNTNAVNISTNNCPSMGGAISRSYRVNFVLFGF